MTLGVSDCEHEALEPTVPFHRDPEYAGWASRLKSLSSAAVSIREATADAQDGRRMKDLQFACSPISVQSVRENASTITERLALLAEIDGVHVGFCLSSSGSQDSDPMFIQVVAVAPDAQRRGIGLALLIAAADREPRRDIALATQDDNVAARSLNERFAKSIGADIRRVNLKTFRRSDLGIPPALGYRAWVIQRSPVEP